MNVAQSNQYYQIPTCIIKSSNPKLYTEEKKLKLTSFLKARMDHDTMRIFIEN